MVISWLIFGSGLCLVSVVMCLWLIIVCVLLLFNWCDRINWKCGLLWNSVLIVFVMICMMNRLCDVIFV